MTTVIGELVGRVQPDLLLLNDGDLTYAKLRLDERSLATAVAHIDVVEDSLTWCAAVERRLGYDPRRRDAPRQTGSNWCSAAWARKPTSRRCHD